MRSRENKIDICFSQKSLISRTTKSLDYFQPEDISLSFYMTGDHKTSMWEAYKHRWGRQEDTNPEIDHITLQMVANIYNIRVHIIVSTGDEHIISPFSPRGKLLDLYVGYIAGRKFVSLTTLEGNSGTAC